MYIIEQKKVLVTDNFEKIVIFVIEKITFLFSMLGDATLPF